MCRIKLMQRCSLWMVLRFLLSAVREPNDGNFLPLNAKSTDLFAVCFRSHEAAQTSKMISVLVASNTLLMILSQSSIWSWSGVSKEMSLSSSLRSHHMSCREWMLDIGVRTNFPTKEPLKRLTKYLVFPELFGQLSIHWMGYFQDFYFIFSEK